MEGLIFGILRYHFDRKGTPFVYLLLTKYGTVPFTYLMFRTLHDPFLTADKALEAIFCPMIRTDGSALKERISI